VTGFLIYTSKENDYRSPEVIKTLADEVDFLIEIEIFFSISCLLLQILCLRLNFEDFYYI
jgi:hypothetical protein